MKRPKISIIGAGNVGATTAYVSTLKGLGDIVLVDIVKGIPQGKGLDMYETTPVLKSSITVTGTNSYAKVKNSDVVVITAGIARKPGMSRDDLLKINTKIVSSVAKEVKKVAPNCVLIVVSNPLDAMVYAASKAGFPKKKVIGMAGVLDSTRFATFLSEATGISQENIHTTVLGGHGDQMIPLVHYSHIAGMPLETFLTKKQIDKIVERTRKGGIEIINYLKTGSAYYAPATSIVEMVEAIIYDKKKILPCAAYLNGEYGTKGVFIGVPSLLGKNGVEKIVEMKLSASEKKSFKENVKHVRSLMKKVDKK